MKRRFPFRRRPTATRLRRVPKPKIAIRGRLEVIGDMARFTFDAALRSPNETLWKNRFEKIADRHAWGAAVFDAIVVYLEASGQALSILDRQVIANRIMPVRDPDGIVRKRRLYRAPQDHYTLLITREVPTARHFIKDDRNLSFAPKHLEDALVAHGVIYDDSRKWLTSPLPAQRVSADGSFRTIAEITPWHPPRLSRSSHDTDR